MIRSFVATFPVVFGLAASILFAQQAPTEQAPPAAKPAAPRLTLMDMVKKSVQRVGATVDAGRSTAQMVVSSYGDPKGGKTTMVVVNDRTRNMLGLYVYNFGSLKDATANREEVYKYLLSANDAITIGAFFVDGEEDIGYKYLMNVGQSLNQAAFESSYLMMAAVARDRKPEIRKLLGLSAKEDKPSEVKKPAEEKPPK